MNYKTMRGLLALGIRVRHESWRQFIYICRDNAKYRLHTGDDSSMPIDPTMYDPEITSIEASAYFIAKYAEGWEVYDESKSQ